MISGQALLKYVRKGEGSYRASDADRQMGLERVRVEWGRKGGTDDSYDDGTIGVLAVTVLTSEGTEHYEFDIAFNGRIPEVIVGKTNDDFGS